MPLVFEERKNFIERLTFKERGLKSVSSIQFGDENERGSGNFKLGSWSTDLESAHTSRAAGNQVFLIEGLLESYRAPVATLLWVP